ncbi:MAG: radical SAM protein [Desulfurococcaceae archaeon]
MNRPEYIIWIFTAKCNLDCIHCYTSRFRNLRELSLAEKLKVAKDIGESGVEYVNLTGGEPLIHPHIKDLLNLLKDYGVEKSIVTNATVVREDIADFLHKTDTYVYVTIEGPRDIHDKIRGAGAYDRAMKGLEVLMRKIGSLSIVTTVNRINFNRISDVVDFVAKIDAEELALLPVMPSGRALETKIYITPGEYMGALNIAINRAYEYGLKLSAWCTPWAPLLKKNIGYWPCRSMSGMDVDPSGDVLLCDILDVRITNVRDKTIIEAFKEYRNNAIVQKIMNPDKLPADCKLCELALDCRGGCFARAHKLSGDFNAGDPLCPRISKLIK